MKTISLLLAVVIIALIIYKQLDSGSSVKMENSGGLTAPDVPTTPKELKTFEKDMNDFINDAAQQRAEELDAAMPK